MKWRAGFLFGWLTICGTQALEVHKTIPMGYSGERLSFGMNLVGLTMHKSLIGSGTVAAVEEKALIPDEADAGILGKLSEGKTYILEILTGTQEGSIQEITQWEKDRLLTPEDLKEAGVKPGDRWALRQAATLNSVFDPRLPGLQRTTRETKGDVVFVPSGTTFGEFKQHLLVDVEGWVGWLDIESGKPSGDTPLVYPDGLIIQHSSREEILLEMHGEVKTGPTRSVVNRGLNLVATPYPSKGHLQELGLEDDLLRADHSWDADTVWIPDGTGSGAFTKYWLDQEGKWKNAGNGETVEGKIPVGSAILIERRGNTASFLMGE